jgi:ferrous-iron efflux pump FieF
MRVVIRLNQCGPAIFPMVEASSNNRLRQAASSASLIVALVLVGVKIWAFLATASISLLTSAADAVIDVAASLVTFAGVRFAGRPADSGHRYGSPH